MELCKRIDFLLGAGTVRSGTLVRRDVSLQTKWMTLCSRIWAERSAYVRQVTVSEFGGDVLNLSTARGYT
jgi:hypothetical protein